MHCKLGYLCEDTVEFRARDGAKSSGRWVHKSKDFYREIQRWYMVKKKKCAARKESMGRMCALQSQSSVQYPSGTQIQLQHNITKHRGIRITFSKISTLTSYDVFCSLKNVQLALSSRNFTD